MTLARLLHILYLAQAEIIGNPLTGQFTARSCGQEIIFSRLRKHNKKIFHVFYPVEKEFSPLNLARLPLLHNRHGYCNVFDPGTHGLPPGYCWALEVSMFWQEFSWHERERWNMPRARTLPFLRTTVSIDGAVMNDPIYRARDLPRYFYVKSPEAISLFYDLTAVLFVAGNGEAAWKTRPVQTVWDILFDRVQDECPEEFDSLLEKLP